MRYVIHSTVRKVISMPARHAGETDAWFLLTDGSHEAIYIGDTKPDLKDGDKINIILEKANVAAKT
jgi:hypothetical protein